MFQNFVVKNFRCLGSILLQPLARVNLIAGQNNTGKTSLLEAIHLHSYPQDCELPFSINELRGNDNLKKLSEEVASWLFYEKHTAAGFEFSSQDEKGNTRFLKMWLGDAATARQHFREAEKAIAGSFLERVWNENLPRIILKTEEKGKEYYAIGVLTENGLATVSSKVPWDGPSILLASGRRSTDEDVRAFSDLEAAKRQEEILPALQVLEPRLRRLSLLVLAGTPVIHGDVGLSRLVPIPFMGEGIGRLLSILLAITQAPGGRVLIDEIENGLHYSVMKAVWRAIARAAGEADVQVFATTHSWECIYRAHQAFLEIEPYELRIHQLGRVGNELVVATYDRHRLEDAIAVGLEVR